MKFISFLNRLKETRLRKGYSVEHISELIGVTPNTYNQYELGTDEPDIIILRKIVVTLDTTSDELLGIK